MRRVLSAFSVRRVLVAAAVCVAAFAGVFAVTLQSAPTAKAWTRGYDTIVLVHGFDGVSGSSTAGDNCDATWGNVRDYMSKAHVINGQSLTWHRQDYREISYYKGDTSCGGRGYDYDNSVYRHNGVVTGVQLTDGEVCWSACEDLHNSIYTQHCSGYYPDGTNSSMDGSNNESIYHLSCLFAWYLHLNFQSGWNVEIVAHSMGGLIVRNAIYQVQRSMATWTMPSGLPSISDVVTFATPHAGEPGAAAFNSTQGRELDSTSSFIGEMSNSAKYPQWGGTDWSMEGSFCDEAVSPASATALGSGHRTVFDYNTSICYSHGGYLTDESDGWDAPFEWCDGSACPTVAPQPAGPGWNQGTGPHSLYHMAYALWLSNW